MWKDYLLEWVSDVHEGSPLKDLQGMDIRAICRQWRYDRWQIYKDVVEIEVAILNLAQNEQDKRLDQLLKTELEPCPVDITREIAAAILRNYATAAASLEIDGTPTISSKYLLGFADAAEKGEAEEYRSANQPNPITAYRRWLDTHGAAEVRVFAAVRGKAAPKNSEGRSEARNSLGITLNKVESTVTRVWGGNEKTIELPQDLLELMMLLLEYSGREVPLRVRESRIGRGSQLQAQLARRLRKRIGDIGMTVEKYRLKEKESRKT